MEVYGIIKISPVTRHRHSITIGTPSTASTALTPDNDSCLHPSIRINIDKSNGIWVIVVAFGVEGRAQAARIL
jgi:hypothetical protein